MNNSFMHACEMKTMVSLLIVSNTVWHFYERGVGLCILFRKEPLHLSQYGSL